MMQNNIKVGSILVLHTYTHLTTVDDIEAPDNQSLL